ncbi:HNH endonuclease domain-containing protein [Stenotrophomonas sp. As-14]|uniref:HNH endonuclease n=1 Tax=Stenotrophomonas sp. As-14 TaxID=3051118 RepID=UPI00256E9D5B|nr:HNH endonuclease domain-containing protein [Stenotrophomonas sp. As-14]
MLLSKQKNRCSYCQMPLEVDENGYRELDHILPKSPSKSKDNDRSKSGIYEDRWITKGYSKFRYSYRNLAVACKQCNTFKGTFDPLLVRSVPKPKSYPKIADLLWYHPQLAKYESHIQVSDDFIFSGLTPSGATVIRVCRLDRVEVLEIKFLGRAKVRASHADSLRMAIDVLRTGYQTKAFGKKHAISVISSNYGLSVKKAAELFQLSISAVTSASALEKLAVACAVVDGRA